ncbi:MAG: hypothetical protein K9I85_01825 [Saprospiraceae bacterium]|nr:hypothetical protein [Saprospiraceae bacterium]
MLPKAVIDLGTNTFHLLVATCNNEILHTIHRQRHFVKLARSGINRIDDQAITDGMVAANQFRQILDRYHVKDVSVLGTAALRLARNARELNQQLEGILGHPIEVIDGQREAQLIAHGVLALLKRKPGHQLIMDIGGGSVEFILIEDGLQVYHISLPIGVAILHHRFHLHDPILSTEVLALEHHIDDQLEPLLKMLTHLHIDHLIGAAGIYEVLSQRPEDQELTTLGDIPVKRLSTLLNILQQLPSVDRENCPEIPPERADLIVSALVLINRVILHTQPRHVTVSPYALKEGRLLEMFAE